MGARITGVRIATWNVNSLPARLPRLLSWLEATGPDVVVLQETKIAQEAFPTAEVAAAGYESVHRGQGRWNGVALLSRVGIAELETDLPGAPCFPDPGDAPEARYIAATCGGVRVAGVYVPNGRTPQDPHYDYKLAWLHALAGHLAPVAAADAPFAVLGDFNVAPNDDDVWDIGAFALSTHVTAPERAALAELRALGLVGCRAHDQQGPAPLHLLGLPGRVVPQGDGHADRPGLRQCRRSLVPCVRRSSTGRRASPGSRGRLPPAITPR